jgi:RNA polymerase sigma-B factor
MASTPLAPARHRRAERIEETEQALRRAKCCEGQERQELLSYAITLNMPVARSIARRYHHRDLPGEDLDQVAMLGLTKAVHGFDPDRGDPFLSYAVPTITGEVKRYFRDSAWSVRPPRRIQELQATVSPAIQELSQELGRAPCATEIAARVSRSADEVAEALACGGCFTPDSLDDRGPEDDGYQLSDRLATEESGYTRVEAVTMLRIACRTLKPRDQQIVYLRFFQDRTQQQIASELGVTQMQVSRLLKRILRDLRDSIEGTPEPARDLSRPA